MTSRDEFDDFARTEWDGLVRTAVLIGYSTADAEDLTQKTLIKCYLAWGKVRNASNRHAYACKILINTSRDHKRRRSSREIPLSQPIGEPEARTSTDLDERPMVMCALQKLHPDQRAAIVLRYYGGLTSEEISKVLGVPSGTIKSRLARALDVLRSDSSLKSAVQDADVRPSKE